MEAKEVLDREFLDIRSRILDVAASLDRIHRADGLVSDDSRLTDISEALQIALSDQGHRAERIQLLFSRDYDQQWKEHFSLPT